MYYFSYALWLRPIKFFIHNGPSLNKPSCNAFIVYRSAVPVSGTALTAEWIQKARYKNWAQVQDLETTRHD